MNVKEYRRKQIKLAKVRVGLTVLAVILQIVTIGLVVML